MKIRDSQPQAHAQAHAKKSKTPFKEKILITVFSLIITASVLCVAGVYLLNTSFFKNTDSGGSGDKFSDTITTPAEIKDKCVNFLVAGIDYVAGSDRGHLTDVIMVVSFDLQGDVINIFQVPRDSYAGENVTSGKINAVYGMKNSGIEGLATMINSMFNLTIDHYVTIDMDGFKRAVDKIGGVEVDVPSRIDLEGVIIEPGLQLLDGITAEKFVRERKSYATSDIKRMEMQQVFLNAMLKKVFSLSNGEVMKVAPTLISDITTDLTLSEILGFYKQLMQVDPTNGIMFHNLPFSPVNGYLSLHKRPIADMLNEFFRPYTPKIMADDLGIIELKTDYEYPVASTIS